MHNQLHQFVSTFVQPEKQERYLVLLKNKKRRSDGLWDLLHDGRHLDQRKFVHLPNGELSYVTAQLKQLGVSGPAYVLAVSGCFDDQLLDLSTVLQAYLGKAKDVVAFFAESNAGYYENHEGEIYVFSSKP